MTEIPDLEVAGHPGGNSTIYSVTKWETMKAFPLCAEEQCLDWAEADGTPIRGRIWYKNTHNDTAFDPQYRKFCFDCAFWNRWFDERDAGSIVVQEGENRVHYHFDPKSPIKPTSGGRILGHSGRRFIVVFLSPHRDSVMTNNLWHQGDIPKHFYDRFEVNATLKTEQERSTWQWS